jgi:Holliday junction resolvase RusA-like endonuclease
MIKFHIPGVPVQQGSKTPWGSEQNPHLKAWRQSVAETAAREFLGDAPANGPVHVSAEFVFPRPKAHYRSGRYADWLKESAPLYHTSNPDLDKLQRAIGDALTGVVIRDDRQIAAWSTVKRYGPHAGATISVDLLPRRDEPLLEPIGLELLR